MLSAFRVLAASLKRLAFLLTSEVEPRRARLVLRWGAAWADHRELSAIRTLAASLKFLALPTSEVELRRAALLLGVGAWEDLRVLSAFRMFAACLNLLASHYSMTAIPC